MGPKRKNPPAQATGQPTGQPQQGGNQAPGGVQTAAAEPPRARPTALSDDGKRARPPFPVLRTCTARPPPNAAGHLRPLYATNSDPQALRAKRLQSAGLRS
eukprot:6187618-Prymnesium_polylepis.1